MKKIISVLMVFSIIVMCLSGCGDSAPSIGPKDTKANVNGEMISANEIIKEINDDATEFYYNYAEKPVEITGTVEYADLITTTLFSRSVVVYEITLAEGWKAIFVYPNETAASIESGDNVTIVSKMDKYDPANEYIYLENIRFSGTGSNTQYNDKSTITKN